MGTDWTLASYIAHNEQRWADHNKLITATAEATEKLMQSKEDARVRADSLAERTELLKDARSKELAEQVQALAAAQAASKEDLATQDKEIRTHVAPAVAYEIAQRGPRAVTGQGIVFVIGAVAVALGLLFTYLPILLKGRL